MESTHVCTVVGARPQFIKSAPVSRALESAGIRETVVHTGQHFDRELSQIFFDELGLREPRVDLSVGSGTHAWQTASIMMRLEDYLQGAPPCDLVLVYGDTNSTVAAALVAAKLHIPVVHVEAGLRSFNRDMPEEINRIVTDHLSRWLFCPTETAVQNLAQEGITRGAYLCGDVMLEAMRMFTEKARADLPLELFTSCRPGEYALATVHRPANTDNHARLAGIFEGLGALDCPVLMPLHPRTRDRMGGISPPANVMVLPPMSYLAMLTLTQHAKRIFTDSGGLQKEAFWLGVPCVTLRPETEWPETLSNGWNRCINPTPAAIASAAAEPYGPQLPFGEAPAGTASSEIARILSEALA